ncbi:VOC family protein [Terrimonas alba]|uniref:VOC family protein n=1 Tax=Terrimonas alba TaxID=3349636 RepID=UPI0035F227EE
MDATTNSLNWFEIPVTDMQRAKHFYQAAFSMHMEESEMMGMQMAFFPYTMGSGKLSGALVQGEFHQPGQHGPLIYLNANPSMDSILEKIEGMGGTVLSPKTQITPEIGYMAIFQDTEGNKVALHSQE